MIPELTRAISDRFRDEFHYQELYKSTLLYFDETPKTLTHPCIVLYTAPNGDVSNDDARNTDATTTSPWQRDDTTEDEDGDQLAGARSRQRRRGSESNNNWPTEEDTDDEPRDTYKYQRRRSRAVLYQLSGSYGRQRTTKGKLQLTKVTVSIVTVPEVGAI